MTPLASVAHERRQKRLPQPHAKQNGLQVAGAVVAARNPAVVAGLAAPRILRLGLPDRFIEQGSREELLECLGLDPVSIAETVRNYIGVDCHVLPSA